MKEVNVLLIPAEHFGSRQSFLEEVYTRESDFKSIFLMQSESIKGTGTTYWNKAKVYLMEFNLKSILFRFRENYFFDYRYLWQILNIVRKEKINIIQVRDLTFPLGVAILCRWIYGTKVVYQKSFPHELRKLYNARYYKLPHLAYMARFIENVILHHMLKYCDKVFPITDVMAEELYKDHKVPLDKMHSIGMGINSENFEDIQKKHQFNRSKIKIVYNGTMAAVNELENILRAIKILKKRLRNQTFLLTFVGGEEKDIARMQKMTNELNLNDEVNFTGFVDRLKVYEICLDHDFGISYYPLNQRFISACPTKLVEYLGLGIPVVATNTVVKQTELINDTLAGVLCGPSPKELSEGIIKLATNYEEYEKSAEKAKIHILDKYNYKKFRSKVGDIYMKLLEKK